jgi:hypothetical protein
VKNHTEIYEALLMGKKLKLENTEGYVHLLEGNLCDENSRPISFSFTAPNWWSLWEETPTTSLTADDVGNAVKFSDNNVSLITTYYSGSKIFDCAFYRPLQSATHVRRNGVWLKLGETK